MRKFLFSFLTQLAVFGISIASDALSRQLGSNPSVPLTFTPPASPEFLGRAGDIEIYQMGGIDNAVKGKGPTKNSTDYPVRETNDA